MRTLAADLIKSRRRKKIKKEYIINKSKVTKKDVVKKLRINHFRVTSEGNFLRRAFFFSIFGFTAVFYAVLCMYDIRHFDGLSMFILACNAAFGFNYYNNESLKKTEKNTGLQQ